MRKRSEVVGASPGAAEARRNRERELDARVGAHVDAESIAADARVADAISDDARAGANYLLPRTPEGRINNCALANGDEERNCQACGGRCPDVNPHPVHVEQYGEERARQVAAERLNKELTQVYTSRHRDVDKYGALPEAPREHTITEPAGETVSVTRGEWLVQPVQYNSFRVGAVTVETTRRPGESFEAAARRAYDVASRVHRGMAEKEMAEYLDYIARVGAEVQARR